MKIGYEFTLPDGRPDANAGRDIRNALEALPPALEHGCYGAGFMVAGRKAKRVARSLCPPGKGRPTTRKGKDRKHLRDSIRVRPVGWRWRGKKVPKSAVVIVAEQPHAHLIELGTKRWKEGPRPFLYPALESGGLNEAFVAGARKHFGKVVRQIESRKLTRTTARAIRLHLNDVDVG